VVKGGCDRYFGIGRVSARLPNRGKHNYIQHWLISDETGENRIFIVMAAMHNSMMASGIAPGAVRWRKQ
jgi:hypothetical protein